MPRRRPKLRDGDTRWSSSLRRTPEMATHPRNWRPSTTHFAESYKLHMCRFIRVDVDSFSLSPLAEDFLCMYSTPFALSRLGLM